MDAEEVFPSDSLLDHIPSLIVDISSYVRAPEHEAIAANTRVADKARELGRLRHQQRASLHQVLREYQLLTAILSHFIQDEATRLMLSPTVGECMEALGRVHEAVQVLSQETVETFVRLYNQTLNEQSERLRQFTRMATHEWRQPLAPIMTGISLLRLPGLGPEQREQTLDMLSRNTARLVEMTRQLERLARLDGADDNASLQEVSLTAIAQEAARQLRDMAEARDVTVTVADEMPAMTVDVGRLELALVNLLSNAIKYCDPGKPERTVGVTAQQLASGEVQIYVRDNGIGIPADRIERIFDRFVRVHVDRVAAEAEAVGGVGLGLAIVDDCVRAMNGTIRVETAEGAGTTFCLTLPPTAAPSR